MYPDLDKYYRGYFDTCEQNPTVKLLGTFDTEQSFDSIKWLCDNIEKQAVKNTNNWIMMNSSNKDLLKKQLVYLLNHVYKLFIVERNYGWRDESYKIYIDTDAVVSKLKATFDMYIRVGVEDFADVLVNTDLYLSNLLETISVLLIINNIEMHWAETESNL